MAREIRGVASSGTLYARIMSPAGLWWNGSAFEAYSAGNYSSYDVAMAEQGDSGVYVADFPSAITTGGTYEYFVHLQAGGSPAEGDVVLNTGRVDWTGTVSIAAAAGSMSGSEFRDYVLRGGFKRTDKDTELYEAATDAVQELRQLFEFGEAETETTSTDTISTLGDYAFNVESDFGLVVGVKLQDGTNAHTLRQLTKRQFDRMYPDHAVTADRGYPKHFCIFNGQVVIGPIPDSVSYTYRVAYSKRGGTITSSSTGVPFTADYREALREKTLAKLYKGLQEYDVSAVHEAAFEKLLPGIIRRERQNKGEGTFTVAPTNL